MTDIYLLKLWYYLKGGTNKYNSPHILPMLASTFLQLNNSKAD